MTRDEVVAFFGNASKVSRALGLTHAAVLAWREVPQQWQFQLEKMTRGQLKADCPLPSYAMGLAARDLPEGRWPRTPIKKKRARKKRVEVTEPVVEPFVELPVTVEIEHEPD
jgi:hypothetical protein